jgi:hypothetical protein
MNFKSNSCKACGGKSINTAPGKQQKLFNLTSGGSGATNLNTMIMKQKLNGVQHYNNQQTNTNLYNFGYNSSKRYRMVIR